MIKKILFVVLLLASLCHAAVVVQFQLTKQKPTEAGQNFAGKLHTISVQIKTWAPGDDPAVDTPFSTDTVSAHYNDVGDSVASQVAVTRAILFTRLSTVLLARNREYQLWVAVPHDNMIAGLTTDLAAL